jgi:hypothetical protein
MKICKTQTELTEALKAGEECGVGTGYFEISGSSTVHAYGSSTVRASGSSTVHASGSSTVHAYGSSTVRAYGSSTVHASGSSTVHASGSSTVRARKFNSVTIHGQKVHASGGVQIHIPDNFTAREWCDFYGVEIKKRIAILYKGLDADYSTDNARSRGLIYNPGTTPIAPDWDGGKAECGGGIHLSPTPRYTLDFNSGAKVFMAFPVKLSQIKPYKNAHYPTKVKVETVCAPIYEVDIDGKKKGA